MLAFTTAVKYYLTQIGCTNELSITMFTELSFYPDVNKKDIASHVNHVVKLVLVKIALDVSVVSAEQYFLGGKTKVGLSSECAKRA